MPLGGRGNGLHLHAQKWLVDLLTIRACAFVETPSRLYAFSVER
jgi:hypothetical protein